VIVAPSAWTASTAQDFTLSPSMSTVHAPQLDVSQPMGVPTRPRPSRKWCVRRVRGGTSSS
jgi:hypothetical protein